MTLTTRARTALPARRRRWPAAIVGLVVLACLAACSSPAAGTSASGPSASPAASASSQAGGTAGAKQHVKVPKKDIIRGLITFNGQYQFSGPASTRGSFSAFPGVTTAKSSCRRIGTNGTPVAGGHRRQFIIPAPPQGGSISLVAAIQPYRGPGTYQKASVVAVGASVQVNGTSYNLGSAGAVESVTFRRDGSGTFTFSNVAAVGSGKPALSGTIRWTCSV